MEGASLQEHKSRVECKHSLVKCHVTAWVSVFSECDLSKGAWLRHPCFWQVMRFITNCPTSWALSIFSTARSDLSSAGIRWKRERSLFKEGLGCPDFEWRRSGISSVPFVPDRCSGIICGYDPLTLEISWMLELSIHSVDSSFILLVTKASGSLFSTPPTMSTIHKSLSVPLPGTLHLEKLIWWTHNVNSGNERHLSNISTL